MKKIKLVLWIIIVVFIGLVFFQNQAFFLEKKGISLNLYFGGQHPIEFRLIVWFLMMLIIGLLISYFYGLPERFKQRKTIKELNAKIDELNAKIDTQIETISQIRSELESRTGISDEETLAAPVDAVNAVSEPSDVPVPSDD